VQSFVNRTNSFVTSSHFCTNTHYLSFCCISSKHFLCSYFNL